jgi:hypothetical protein
MIVVICKMCFLPPTSLILMFFCFFPFIHTLFQLFFVSLLIQMPILRMVDMSLFVMCWFADVFNEKTNLIN